MASASSASSVEKSYIYDVFVSFRGKDLRLSFVDHLFEAFRRHGVIVFKDNKDIEVGEKISDELPKAIKDSKFHMVIFSERYADSYWCLNELVEILESQNPEKERTFYPIFYDVKPNQVREQKGPVGEAFAKHSENEAAGRWRAAMAQAASLEGWELTKNFDGHEVPFIQKIVHAISQKPYFAKFGINDNLVGMATQVEKLLLSLQVGSDDFRTIGITGLGGMGKTTLASVVFDRIANQFDGKSFVQNVRERSQDPRGLQDMQKQILTSVFGDQSIDVPSEFEGRIMMKRRMPNIKVLVVLDDVNHGNQLEALAEPSWFRTGSRIIITSRDRQVLVAHGVESHNIHDVSTISDEDAICLLSRYAFKTESPAQGYEKLFKEVLRYAAGLPLTIKTLSSSLYACSTVVWEDAIKRLETIPWDDTLKILEISYDALQKDHKDIFLYVACLLKGQRKKRATRILESLGFHAQFGLGVLEQKSLIIFRDGHKYYNPNDAYDDDDKRLLDMHDHVEEMGMHIVRSLYPDEPERHKLLWNKDEIENIIKKDMGTEAIRGIKLMRSRLPTAKVLKSLRKMRRLCFLHVGRPYYEIDEFVKAGNYIPSSLQYLHWYGYPCRYLPKTFQADKLVVMEMSGSHIHQLWEGGEKKVLPKLRLLDLSGSELETFDSDEMTPNLEELVLRVCKKLVEVNISDEWSHLKKLDLSGCRALEKLTISNECRNLEDLELNGCISLRDQRQLHGECPSSLKSLSISKTNLRGLNLVLTPKLEVLSVEEKKRLLDLGYSEIETFDSAGMLPNLEELLLRGCEKLVEVNISDECSHLKKLDLFECKALEKLTIPIECPSPLKSLNLFDTKLRCLNLGMAPNLELLSVKECEDLEELLMPVECPMLTELNLSETNLRSLNLGLTPNLKELSVKFCEDLAELVMPGECRMLTKLFLHSIDKLCSFNLGMTLNLEVLSVEYCKELEELVMPVEYPMLTKLSLIETNLRSFNLGLTPNLEILFFEGCEELEELVMPVECTMLRHLCLTGNKELRSFNLGLTPNLEVLSLSSCQKIYLPVELPRLRVLDLSNHNQVEHYYGSFSYPLEKLKSLEKLRLCFPYVNRLPVDDSIYMLKHHLKVLDLRDFWNLEQLPEDLDRLECLEELILQSCSSLENIPDCICNMTRLRVLDLGCCRELKKLPEDLDRLECLEELILKDCKSLENIPDCICNMTRLKTLNLFGCSNLEKLPDEFRRLQSLQVLDVRGTTDRLKNLPESISQLKHLDVRNSWMVI